MAEEPLTSCNMLASVRCARARMCGCAIASVPRLSAATFICIISLESGTIHGKSGSGILCCTSQVAGTQPSVVARTECGKNMEKGLRRILQLLATTSIYLLRSMNLSYMAAAIISHVFRVPRIQCCP